ALAPRTAGSSSGFTAGVGSSGGRAFAFASCRSRPDGGGFGGAEVAPAHVAVLAGEVDLVGVVGIDAAGEAVAAADAEPVLVDRAEAALDERRAPPTAVVLQAAVDLVVPAGVDGHVVELADGRRVDVVPDAAAVVAVVAAAVAAD